MITVISLILTIIGGIVWLLVGIADFNLLAWLFAGNLYFIARIIYVLVGIAALWLIYYLIRHFSRILHGDFNE